MHSLLARQLRQAGFMYNELPTDIAAWQKFLERISHFYVNAERDRELYERGVVMPVSIPHVEEKPELPTYYHDNVELHAVISAMRNSICVFNDKGKLVFSNPAAEHYLEAPQATLQQSDLIERFDLHNKEENSLISTEMLIQRLLAGQSFRDSNAILHQREKDLPVACEFNPIKESNTIVGFVLLFIDISELKNIESDLIAARDAAENASKAKSQFLSSMSHELRTPMNAILGYSELLKEDLHEALEEFNEDYIDEMQQYVGNILQAGWHLLGLINKVLDLTRIEAGKLEVSIEKVELVDLVKECVSIVNPLAEKREIEIDNQTEAMPPQDALIDRARLKQVIINLLSNAVKYNKEQGEIKITLSHPDNEHLCLAVADTGIGLSKEQQEKIFEPFTRLSGLNLIEGTGIGLTITKRLLEIMDGQIHLESEEGEGTTFYVTLPTGTVTDEVDIEIDRNEKYILLYVEDSRTNVSLVSQILKARPQIALMSAHTGEMGLELAHLHHPDVILLDINLPGMDGYDVLKQLQGCPETKGIPVLALTAMDNSRQVQQGKAAGFLTYIVKPLDIKQFLQAIDLALEEAKRRKNTLAVDQS